MLLNKKAMKKLLIGCVLLIGFAGYGQEETGGEEEETEEVTEETPQVQEEGPEEGWFSKGIFTFLFNQTAFSNWLAGGENSIGGNAGINYDLNYHRGFWNWDNKILISYGLTKREGVDLRKTDDRFEFTSLVSKKTSGYWSYSLFANFRSQLTPGYDYGNDPDENYKNSGFFRPAYLSFGPGMAWEKTENLKFNLSPATSKITFLGGEVFSYDSGTGTFISSNERTAFGVEPGERFRYELGFYASGYFKFTLMKNVTAENIINLYANYLEDFDNLDMNYQLNIAMKINEYLGVNIAFQAIYDDNAFPGFQIREVFGMGLNYGF